MSIGINKRFYVDDREYGLSIGQDGNISFYLVQKAPNSSDIYNLYRFDDEESMSDENIFHNPMKVFIAVKKEILAWVSAYNPYMLYFHPSNSRRYAIYEWMSKKLVKDLPGYHFYMVDDGFYFYRKKDVG